MKGREICHFSLQRGAKRPKGALYGCERVKKMSGPGCSNGQWIALSNI